jgi:hypothetical protein
MGEILSISIPKAGKGYTFDLDMDDIQGSEDGSKKGIPSEVIREMLLLGAKAILNRGMSTEKSSKDMSEREAEANQKVILGIVEKNWKSMQEGTIRFTGGKQKKLTGALNVIAMRIARETVKFALKREGYVVSHYKAAQITELAKQLLETEDGEEIMVQAKEELDRRNQRQKALKANLHLDQLEADPELVKKAESKKRKKGEEVSLAAIQGSVRASRREGPTARH